MKPIFFKISFLEYEQYFRNYIDSISMCTYVLATSVFKIEVRVDDQFNEAILSENRILYNHTLVHKGLILEGIKSRTDLNQYLINRWRS